MSVMKTATKAAEKEVDPKKLLREIANVHLDTAKLKENDHRILGQKLELFSFNDMAPGMAFWHDRGLIVYNELTNYWRDEHRKAGYQEISTPQVLDKRLWQVSGHWEKYKDNIFLTQYEGRDFAMKPMNCPGGILVFKSRSRSYKELPLRMAELGVVHRQELSGVLAGLFRVIRITQDDAHIYCTEGQLESEIIGIMDLIHTIYSKFGFEYHTELSTRPEKRIGSDETWDKAERILEEVLKKKKVAYKLNPGDGAFYGPKIDFHIKDSQGRTWQCGTIQLDFAMPERFELEYMDNDNKMKRPVMLHRTVYGALERFIGVLLEHTNGNLPVWLSPVQARVLSFTDRNIESTKKTYGLLKDAGVRAELDITPSTVNEKVRNAELLKIPYIIVLGDKEEQAGTIAVRAHGKKPQLGVKPEEFLENLKKEIAERL
jgi:threonyl-tRNA synthetase